MARAAITVALAIAVILGYLLPANIIAVGTAMWFSITAAAFLSMYIFCFWKRATKAGVITGLLAGTAISVFWIVFVFKKSAEALGICKALTGQAVLIAAQPWPTVDSIVIALPIAFILTVIVSLLTKPPEKNMDKCFREFK